MGGLGDRVAESELEIGPTAICVLSCRNALAERPPVPNSVTPPRTLPNMANYQPPPGVDPRKVLVVHGRSEPARKGLFEFLRAIGLEPIEWSEAIQMTGQASPYIGDVRDVAFGAAQAVVVLQTPDDVAHLHEWLTYPGDPECSPKMQPGRTCCSRQAWPWGGTPIAPSSSSSGRSSRSVTSTAGTQRPPGRLVAEVQGSGAVRRRARIRVRADHRGRDREERVAPRDRPAGLQDPPCGVRVTCRPGLVEEALRRARNEIHRSPEGLTTRRVLGTVRPRARKSPLPSWVSHPLVMMDAWSRSVRSRSWQRLTVAR